MLNFDNNNNIPSTSADMSNNLEELIFPSTSLRVPDRPNIERRKEGCFQILFYPLIKMSCTEQSIWALSTLCGLFVLCAQTAPIFLLDWVHIREPRPLNLPKEPSSLINDDRGPLEIPFEYNAGYFGMCRYWIATNESLLLNNANNPSTDFLLPLSELNKLIPKLAPDACVWNSAYSGEDLSEFSFATSAILVRLLIPTIMHCSGALLTVFALLFSFLGHFGHNWKTIFSAILYVFGGLIIFIGVLQVICIVDDEMAPRMKPNAAGEPSVFTFRYGSSFMAAALSFLPVQLCVWLEVTAFFLRHKTPTDKSLVVPGLNELLNQVTIIRTRTHRLGRLGGFSLQGGNNNNCGGSSGRFSNRRRSSRASKDLSGILNNNNLNNDSSIIIKKDYSFHHLLV